MRLLCHYTHGKVCLQQVDAFRRLLELASLSPMTFCTVLAAIEQGLQVSMDAYANKCIESLSVMRKQMALMCSCMSVE